MCEQCPEFPEEFAVAVTAAILEVGGIHNPVEIAVERLQTIRRLLYPAPVPCPVSTELDDLLADVDRRLTDRKGYGVDTFSGTSRVWMFERAVAQRTDTYGARWVSTLSGVSLEQVVELVRKHAASFPRKDAEARRQRQAEALEKDTAFFLEVSSRPAAEPATSEDANV